VGNFWLFYWWVVFLPLLAAAAARRARRRRQMGPRVLVSPEEFLKVVEREKALVIKGPKVILQGTTYVTRAGDYYYYTTVREPLRLPDGVEVKEARNILL
jgi:hypothetical protein